MQVRVLLGMNLMRKYASENCQMDRLNSSHRRDTSCQYPTSKRLVLPQIPLTLLSKHLGDGFGVFRNICTTAAADKVGLLDPLLGLELEAFWTKNI